MLERNLETIDLVKELGSNFHSHSYFHNKKKPKSLDL